MKYDTGDIVLFSGNYFISNLIKVATKSRFSHVGVIYREPDEEPLVFHSTSTTTPIGTKKVKLSTLLKTYDGEIYIRKILPRLTEKECAKAKEYIDAHMGVRYESSKIELAMAAIGRKVGYSVNNPTAALYCSEMVGNLYRYIGLMSHKKQLIPEDFSINGEEYLELADRFLGPTKCILF